jgi:catechol 2,3-dioxygenase-like lactoylglutathione lyase family enzyme
MKKLTALVFVLVLLLPAARASAQLVAAKDGPIVYGHHHVNATSADEHKKFWAETLGGSVVKIGTNNQEIIRITNVLIFMRAQAAKGGTKGSTADHIGLSVPNLRQTLDKAKANGYRIVTTQEAPANITVTDDIARVDGGGITGLGYVLGPDETKVELLEIKQQKEAVKLHHIHFFGEKNTEMRDWYIKVFGAAPVTSANPAFVSANLPGVVLNFSPSPTPTVGTAGRAVDHIGFEVKNLEAFLKNLESQGIKPSVPLRRIDALGLNIAFVVDPWGTNIELTEGLDKVP